jgi:hypothetical protein
MTPQEALQIINNLDYEEKKLRFAPKWSIVSFDTSGQIIDVARYKEAPQTIEQIQEFSKHPKSMQFTSCPGQIKTAKELVGKIKEPLRILRIVELPENKGKRWVKA